MMLVVDRLSVHYGKIMALMDVSLSVNPGEIVGIVGPNGAGKSTLLRTITGLHRPTAGEIRYDDSSLVGDMPERIVRRGIALVPEGRRILATLTVEENLLVGASPRRDRADVRKDIAAMTEMFPALGTYLSSPAGRLSGGEQQQLAMARALISRPRLLMMDEPSLGLAPRLVDVVFEVLQELKRTGVTVVLVEQKALRTIEFADRTYVLTSGRILAEGTTSELRARFDFTQAYLGQR